jgi:hypothetical protein
MQMKVVTAPTDGNGGAAIFVTIMRPHDRK